MSSRRKKGQMIVEDICTAVLVYLIEQYNVAKLIIILVRAQKDNWAHISVL